MTDSLKTDFFPLLKFPLDILSMLPHYLDTVEDFVHLSSSCKTLHNVYLAHPPSSGLLFELAAASSLKAFDPKPYLLMAGAARQMGEWAIETPENRVEFHESFRTEGIDGLFKLFKKRAKLDLGEIRSLNQFRKSIFEPLISIIVGRCQYYLANKFLAMRALLQIAIFGDLFATNTSNFYQPGVVHPMDTSIRLDWWAKCCPDMGCKDSSDIINSTDDPMGRHQMAEIAALSTMFQPSRTFTLKQWMHEFPEYFDISDEEYKGYAYKNTYHDSNQVFQSLLPMQGLKSLELLYLFEVREPSLDGRATVNAAMTAFRMDESQIHHFAKIDSDMMHGKCRDLGTVVNIQHDIHFVCGRAPARRPFLTRDWE